jgi:branched-chain amino acid transport system ATP-binding protein
MTAVEPREDDEAVLDESALVEAPAPEDLPHDDVPSSDSALLEVRGLRAGYGGATVLHGIDVSVAPGEVVVVLGANGAGKTTLLRAVAGLIAHSAGEIVVKGDVIRRARPEEMLRRGIGLVPQGRGTLIDLTVRDNLRVGAVTRKDRSGVSADIDRWCDVFPALAKRRDQVAGTLSGGEQQMLAIARAMMLEPRIILLDEPTEGLMPRMVGQIREIVEVLHGEGVAILLVEQNVPLTLGVSERVYIMEKGVVRHHAPAAEIRADQAVIHQYLGV